MAKSQASRKRELPKKSNPHTKTKTIPQEKDEAIDPSHIDTLLPQLLARHPAITDIHRQAFASLVTNEQADALGTQTQAIDVRAQAVAWAPLIDQALREHAAALKTYRPARFVFLLEGIQALHEAIRKDEQKRAKVGSVRSAASAVRERVVAVRSDNLSAMRAYAGARASERAELTAAIGSTDTDENLLKSGAAIAELGKKWLERPAPEAAALAESSGLDKGLVQALIDAAKELKDAMTDTTLEGNARPRDSAAVNRVEGRLSFELREVRRIFNEASEKTGLVPKLNPRASVRHLFVRPAGNGAGQDEPADAAPPASPAKTPATP